MTQAIEPQERVATASTESSLGQKLWGQTWVRASMLFIALVLFAVLAASVASAAPPYDVVKLDPAFQAEATIKQMQRIASSYAMARDTSGFDNRQLNAANIYFEKYVPAKITDPDALTKLSETMKEANGLMERALRNNSPGAGNIMRWLYSGLKPVAMGNYQLPARVNAIHFISRLSRPAAGRGGVPQPYPFVLTDLLTIYEQADAPEAIKATALHGLDRFVRYSDPANVPAAEKQKLIDHMTQLLQSDPPASGDRLVHACLQNYAVNILSTLSNEPTLGTQLVSISTDQNKPNLIALHSAATIGRLPVKLKAGDFKTDEVLENWTNRILAAFEREAARLAALDAKPGNTRGVSQPPPPSSFLKRTTEEPGAARPGNIEDMDEGGMMDMGEMYGDEGGMQTMEGYGDEMGDMMSQMMGVAGGVPTVPPQPPEIIAGRKKLNHVIQQIWIGVTGTTTAPDDMADLKPTGGIMTAVPADQMDAVTKWLEAVSGVADAINDTSLTSRQAYQRAVQAQVVAIKDYLKSKNRKVQPESNPIFDQFSALGQ